MTSVGSVETNSSTDLLDSIRRAVRAERNRTEIEREAFEDFANRITDLEPTNEPSVVNSEHRRLHEASGPVALQSQPVSGVSATDTIAAIKEAYEETVMSVPFYAAEYGETYEESIREEFGSDVATAVTQSNSFNRYVKQALLAKVEKCRTQRRVLLETCDRELQSVDETAAVVNSVDEQLDTFESSPIAEQGFESLEAHWTRLSTLEDKCEQATTARQATIHEHRTEFRLPVDTPDICAYLYAEFNTAYPILSLCSDLARRVENGRQQLVRELSSCS